MPESITTRIRNRLATESVQHRFTRIGDKKRVRELAKVCAAAGHTVTKKGEVYVYCYEARADDGSMVFRAVDMGRCWAITYYEPHFIEPEVTQPPTPTGFAQHLVTHPS